MIRFAQNVLEVVGAAAAVAALFALAPASAHAQRAHIQISSGPYFQGESVDVHLVVEDFEEDPVPEIEVSNPTKGRLDFVGVSPSTRSSISIVNGRMTQTKEVRFIYQYRFTATAAGTFAVGPFRVKQGAVERTTGPVQVKVDALGKSDRVRVNASWPRADVYPGQRFTVKLEWWLEKELNDNMHHYRIEVPIFNRGDLFRYVDAPAQAGDTELVVETATGKISLKAKVSDRMEGNRRFKVVTAERILIPLQPGEFNFTGTTVVVDEVVRWRRDLFGQRTPQGVRKVPTIGDPRKLVVRDVPKVGRPETFAGAIGRGFSLEVTADRSVLQVGDPIELTLVLRGDGNLEGAGLPDLATGGLSPDLFRSPTGSPGGVVADGAKTFRLHVRVLDESVREIPPIPYSYFDSAKKEFVTVESRPIALSVRRGQLITAADVVSGADPAVGEEKGEQTRFAQSPDIREPSRGSRTAFGDRALSGANLSIVRDPDLLLARGQVGALGTAAVASLYGVSFALVAAAFVYRRRSDLDPTLVSQRKLFSAERKTIASAAGMPRGEAMAVLAGALRSMLRAASIERPDGLDAFLSECDAVAYARGDVNSEPVAASVIERAGQLASAIEEGVA